MGITVREVTKRYGPFKALRGVSVRIDDGEQVGLLGPNGSGKTTLLRILTGLERTTGGSVEIDGVEVGSDNHDVQEKFGFVSHETMLYGDLTARENLNFHARLWGLDDGRVEEVLELVNLQDRASNLPREYSHGMQKRLALARAILHSPDILFLDEPFSGLDQQSIETVRDAVADRTVILATHELGRVLDFCDRVLILDQGELGVDMQTAEVETETEFRNRYRGVVR